ncbi:capsular exopolysaccharide biosynthesis protein [Xenococcus sp. PCC 7305]|uniref:GumC family protein n=1 Tax=Xenococcus sp. PCC 7305 TaxID=102125 RepID=UPI0002AD1B8B|nr:polysaccharide biosynthesis tyrosine autokinase [Xenococcus sp. PCC 7305]ELS03004.1 capsular exopolysaccharide biosynthesis protein [Xenococcus sp. PCC 7305]
MYPVNNSSSNGSYTQGNYPESKEKFEVEILSYLQKIQRRWKPALAVFLLTAGSIGLASVFLTTKYQAGGKILFEPQDNLTDLGNPSNDLQSLTVGATPLVSQKEILTSSPILQKTIDQLSLTDAEGEPLTPEKMTKKLKADLVGASDVIEITYEDKDPQIASNVVNTLMNIFLENKIANNQKDTESADFFVESQLPQVEKRLEEYESILQNIRERNNIVDLTQEKRVLVQEIGTLNRQISAIGAQLQGAKAQTGALSQELGLSLEQAISANQLGRTPIVQSIVTELGNTESQLSQERQRFNDNHPEIVSLLDTKASLRRELQQQIAQKVGSNVQISDGLLQSDLGQKENPLERFISLKIDELSLQQQFASMNDYQQAYLQRAKELPRLEKEEQEAIRKVENIRTTYENLLNTQVELDILQNKQTANARIIEPAIAPEKGSSGQLALMALGILSGLLLSNLTAIILDKQDRSLKNISEVKKKLPYKVLGIIPENKFAKREDGIMVQQDPDSYTSEIYRMIQANLKFMTSQRPPKVILVTSSIPGEGKSTVTANLAAAISQLGRKVLLIDGDLRKASQHQLWGVSNQKGVKELLTEKIALNQITQQPMPNMDLLTSGEIISNPLSLLDSLEMSELVAKARREYDLILIDAPPLPVTADVLTLSKLVDGIMFVSRPGVVEHESAELAQETLISTGQKVLGMVINGVDPKEFDRYSYCARYGKSYFSRSTNNNVERSKALTV